MSLSSYNGFSPKLRDDSWEWLKAEVAVGRVEPPSKCEACGETRGHLDHHTEDYSRPFGPHIYRHQLCFRCHMAVHARFRSPGMWTRYIEMLEAGAIYEPLMSRKEIGKIWLRGWVEKPVSMGPPRARLEFFRGLTMEKVDVVGDVVRSEQLPLFEFR